VFQTVVVHVLDLVDAVQNHLTACVTVRKFGA